MIFDFDGTLVDSEPIHALATREGLAVADIDLTVEEFLGRWVGLPDIDCYLQVARDRGRTLEAPMIARIQSTKNATYERLVLEGQVPLCPGVLALVRSLESRYPLAVCSAARGIEIEAALRRHGLRASFQTVVAVEDVKQSKPHPEGYLLAAKRLGIEPASCVAIEDTPRGIEAARAAGMAVAGVAQTIDASRLTGATCVRASMLEVDVSALSEAHARHARGAS